MSTFVDTNIGLRWANRDDPRCVIVSRVLRIFVARQEHLWMAPQNVVEFWSVATRPVTARGLGYSCERADQMVGRIESRIGVLPELPDVQKIWRDLVRTHNIRGRKVFDVRLVAFMMAYTIPTILTFNVADFARFPGITPVDPGDMA